MPDKKCLGLFLTSVPVGVSVTVIELVTMKLERVHLRRPGDTRGSGREACWSVWFGDYKAANIVVSNADVDNMRVGVSSPFITTGPRRRVRTRVAQS